MEKKKKDRAIDDGQEVVSVGSRRIPSGHRQLCVGLSRRRTARVHHIGVRGRDRLEETVEDAQPQEPGDLGEQRRGPGLGGPGGQGVRERLGRSAAGAVRVHRR